MASYWNSRLGWKWDQLEDLLPAKILDKLAAIIIHDELGAYDFTSWKEESYGNFSVSSAYDIVVDTVESIEASKWNRIWKSKVPNRISTFL